MDPWHDQTRFGRAVLEAMPHEERRFRLGELEVLIDARVAPVRDWDPFWREVRAITEDLTAMGHDLWRHDYDGTSKALWGFDYMRIATAGQLQIQFDYEGPTKTFWRDLNGQYGCDTPEDPVESYGIRPPR